MARVRARAGESAEAESRRSGDPGPAESGQVANGSEPQAGVPLSGVLNALPVPAPSGRPPAPENGPAVNPSGMARARGTEVSLLSPFLFLLPRGVAGGGSAPLLQTRSVPAGVTPPPAPG